MKTPIKPRAVSLLLFFFPFFLLGLLGCGGGGGGSPTGADTNPYFQTPPDDALRGKIDQAITRIKARQLHSQNALPWVIMHAIIAFDQTITVYDAAVGTETNAVTYLCTRATWQNQPIFRVIDGRVTLPTRNISFGLTDSYIVQDHVDQYLFAFGGAGVPVTQAIVADDGKTYSVDDLVQAAISGYQSTQELAWTMVSLALYRGVSSSFSNSAGQAYTLADLVTIAIQQDSTKLTEAGTHHLYAIGLVLNKYREGGGALTGPWQSAREYLDLHVARAKASQEVDGSFSLATFANWATDSTASTLVWGTGHMVEWLTQALSADQLKEGWVTAAVSRLTEVILANDVTTLSDGGMYHAANALRLYRNTVFP